MWTASEQDGATGGRDVGTALRRYWWLALLVTLPLVFGATWYAQSRPDEYEVEATVAFIPRQRPETSADLMQLLLPKYAVYARSQQTVQRLAERLDEDPDRLRAAVVAVVPPDTAQLDLTVDLGSARRSSRMANALAEDVVRFARRDRVLSASTVTDAVPPEHPTGPNRLALVFVGTAVAVVAGVVAAVLALRRRHHALTAEGSGALRYDDLPPADQPPRRVRETIRR